MYNIFILRSSYHPANARYTYSVAQQLTIKEVEKTVEHKLSGKKNNLMVRKGRQESIRQFTWSFTWCGHTSLVEALVQP